MPDGTRGCCYEPKWDGFRCIVFRDGDEVELGSRNDRPLTRYFPELVELLPGRAARSAASSTARSWWSPSGGLDFDTLQQRLHPAASRVRMLAEETPASFVAFDLLALDDRDLTGEPFARAAPAARGRCSASDLERGAPHADDRRSRRRARTGSPASRAPGSTA